MTHTLPEHFPFQELPVSDQYRVRAFYRQFVEEYYEHYGFGHFLLAAYATVPAYLTPDLIHKIWQNFNNYRWREQEQIIHRVAAPDILLSPLCREVGYDLYEMYEPIRQALNTWLHQVYLLPEWAALNIAAPERIAKFVHEYHALSNPGATRWGKGYLEPQLRDTLVYLAPEKAQERLLNQLQLAISQPSAHQQSEIVRILNSIAALDRRVQVIYRAKDPNAVPALRATAQFAEAWKALIQQYDEGFLKQLRKDPSLKSLLQKENLGFGFPVEMDQDTFDKVGAIELPTLHALLIGVNWSEGRKILEGCVNDVEHIQELLSIYSKKNTNFYYPDQQIYTDGDAKEKDIKDALTSIIRTSKDGDSIIIYYSGSDLYNSKGRILTFYDSLVAGEDSTGLYQSELEETILELILVKRVHVLLVMDTCFYIKKDQYSALSENKLRKNTRPLKGSLVIYFASEVGKNALEIEANGKKFGLFTNALLTVVTQHELLDYQSILQKIREVTGTRQIPQLEAYGSTAAFYEFLTGKPGKQIFQLVHFKKENEWRVSAGRTQGITPSLGAFPTLLRTSTGADLTVIIVEADYSLVEVDNVKIKSQLRNLIAQGKLNEVIQSLLQWAPGHTEYLHLSTRLKSLNEQPLGQSTISYDNTIIERNRIVLDLLDLLDKTSFDNLDKNLTYESILVQKAPEQFIIVNQEKPIITKQAQSEQTSNNFTYFTLLQNHPNPHFFLRDSSLQDPLLKVEYLLSLVSISDAILMQRVEWCCRYLLMQKIEGKPAGIKEKVKIHLSKIEGQPIQPDSMDSLSAKNNTETSSLLLNYAAAPNGETHAPAFRCSLLFSGELNGSVYIHAFLYTEEGFQVAALPVQEWSDSYGRGLDFRVLHEIQISFPHKEKLYETCLLESKLLNTKAKTETHYQLNILCSKSRLQLGVLPQAGFDLWNEKTSSLPQPEERLTIQEWDTIRIPIKVVRKEPILLKLRQFQKDLGYTLFVPQFFESPISCLDLFEKTSRNILQKRQLEDYLMPRSPQRPVIEKRSMVDLSFSTLGNDALSMFLNELRIDKAILSSLLGLLSEVEVELSDVVRESCSSMIELDNYLRDASLKSIKQDTYIVISILKVRVVKLRLKTGKTEALSLLESVLSSYLPKNVEFLKDEEAGLSIKTTDGKYIAFAFQATQIKVKKGKLLLIDAPLKDPMQLLI